MSAGTNSLMIWRFSGSDAFMNSTRIGGSVELRLLLSVSGVSTPTTRMLPSTCMLSGWPILGQPPAPLKLRNEIARSAGSEVLSSVSTPLLRRLLRSRSPFLSRDPIRTIVTLPGSSSVKKHGGT